MKKHKEEVSGWTNFRKKIARTSTSCLSSPVLEQYGGTWKPLPSCSAASALQSLGNPTVMDLFPLSFSCCNTFHNNSEKSAQKFSLEELTKSNRYVNIKKVKDYIEPAIEKWCTSSRSGRVIKGLRVRIPRTSIHHWNTPERHGTCTRGRRDDHFKNIGANALWIMRTISHSESLIRVREGRRLRSMLLFKSQLALRNIEWKCTMK